MALVVLDKASREKRARRLLERLDDDHCGALAELPLQQEVKEIFREDDGLFERFVTHLKRLKRRRRKGKRSDEDSLDLIGRKKLSHLFLRRRFVVRACLTFRPRSLPQTTWGLRLVLQPPCLQNAALFADILF